MSAKGWHTSLRLRNWTHRLSTVGAAGPSHLLSVRGRGRGRKAHKAEVSCVVNAWRRPLYLGTAGPTTINRHRLARSNLLNWRRHCPTASGNRIRNVVTAVQYWSQHKELYPVSPRIICNRHRACQFQLKISGLCTKNRTKRFPLLSDCALVWFLVASVSQNHFQDQVDNEKPKPTLISQPPLSSSSIKMSKYDTHQIAKMVKIQISLASADICGNREQIWLN